MVGSRSVLRRAWSRPQRGGGARSKERPGKKGSTGARTHELKGVRASTLKRLLRSPFSGSPGLLPGNRVPNRAKFNFRNKRLSAKRITERGTKTVNAAGPIANVLIPRRAPIIRPDYNSFRPCFRRGTGGGPARDGECAPCGLRRRHSERPGARTVYRIRHRSG